MHLTIALDFLALTALVWLMGGARHRSGVLPPSRILPPAAISTIVAYGLLAGLVIGEWAG